MRICLAVTRLRGTAGGSEPSHYYVFEQAEVLVGRDAAVEVRLPDPAVSLVHLRLLRQKGGLVVIDAGSTNGTWLNQRRLPPKQPVALSPGSRVMVGPFLLSIEAPGDQPCALTRAEDTAGHARQMVLEMLGALGGQPWIEVVSGAQQGLRLEIPAAARLIVGRGELCALRLDDQDVSREHLELCRDGDQVTVRDLGSKNSFELNGEKVSGPVALRHGDELELGSTRLRFGDPAERFLAELSAEAVAPGSDGQPPASSGEVADLPPAPPAAVPDAPRRGGVGLQLLLAATALLLAAGIGGLVYLLL